LGVNEVQRVRRLPPPQPCTWPRPPAEGSGRNGLAQAVERHRAMGRRAPEEVSPARVCGIAVGAGIYEAGRAEDRALDAQQISVPVAQVAERSDVEDQLV